MVGQILRLTLVAFRVYGAPGWCTDTDRKFGDKVFFRTHSDESIPGPTRLHPNYRVGRLRVAPTGPLPSLLRPPVAPIHHQFLRPRCRQYGPEISGHPWKQAGPSRGDRPASFVDINFLCLNSS